MEVNFLKLKNTQEYKAVITSTKTAGANQNSNLDKYFLISKITIIIVLLNIININN